MHSPLTIRPSVFSAYGLYEFTILATWSGIIFLFLKNASTFIPTQASAQQELLFAVFFLLLCGCAIYRGIRLVGSNLKKYFLPGLLATAAAILGWKGIIFLAGKYHVFSKDSLALAFIFLLLAFTIGTTLTRAADLLFYRSLSFDGSRIQIRSLLRRTTIIDVYADKIVETWYSFRPFSVWSRATRWGETKFGCDKNRSVFYETHLGRGWKEKDLKVFTQAINKLLKHT